MSQQSRPRRVKELRRIKGDWSAGGHSFDDRMRCTLCRTPWLRHQKAPRYCRRASASGESEEP